MYWRENEIDKALADFNKSIEIDPESGLSFKYRARVRKKMGDLSGANDDFTRAIELEAPDLHMVYNERGLTYKNNAIKHAIYDFDKAIELKPDYIYP